MPVKSNPLKYPRWIFLPNGKPGMVPDHVTHSSLTGLEYNEDAELVTAQTREVPPAPDCINAQEEALIARVFAEPPAPVASVKTPTHRRKGGPR